MRHFEIINETTEEDRAILSLAAAIYSKLKEYEDVEPDISYSPDDDYFDPDADFDDEAKPDDELITVGTIGSLFNTPLEILNPVTIELQSNYGINERMRKEKGADVTKEPSTGVILGLWYPHNSTMVFNKDYLGSNSLKSTVSHELRHALDDYKSEFKANSSNKYTTAKNKSYRKVTKDPHMGNLAYLAEPAEINARFIQVLHDMVSVIDRAIKLDPSKIEPLLSKYLKQSMANHRISDLFPDKDNSKDYKRLMKRAADFIQKELKHKLEVKNQNQAQK
jgi:hypothetical protein